MEEEGKERRHNAWILLHTSVCVWRQQQQQQQEDRRTDGRQTHAVTHADAHSGEGHRLFFFFLFTCPFCCLPGMSLPVLPGDSRVNHIHDRVCSTRAGRRTATGCSTGGYFATTLLLVEAVPVMPPAAVSLPPFILPSSSSSIRCILSVKNLFCVR